MKPFNSTQKQMLSDSLKETLESIERLERDLKRKHFATSFMFFEIEAYNELIKMIQEG